MYTISAILPSLRKPILCLLLLLFGPLGFSQPLIGTYTIDAGSPTSGTNYNSFTDAVSALTSNGIIGPVTFNVASGIYTEQISLPPITGSSAFNTIRFQSQSGDSTDVVLEFPSSAVIGNNYTVNLDGADYIIFREMTLSRTGSSNYARVVDLTGNAANNLFESCQFLGVAGSSNSNGALVYSGDNVIANSNNSFNQNRFVDGHAGIWYEGASGVLKPGLSITNNHFETYRYGIYLRYLRSISVSGNHFQNASTFNSAQSKGIYCFHCDNDLEIIYNKVLLNNSTNNYGIELATCEGDVGMVGLVANNMIIVAGSGTVQGITSGSLTTYKDYVFNSIQCTGSNPTSGRAYYQNGSNNIRILNNVFSNDGGGYAMQVLAPTTGVIESDHNDLYVLGVNIGNWGGSNAASLAAWRSTSGHDSNSVNVDPIFTSATDLHASASGIENAAEPYPGISDDFDRQSRDTLNPDIGCDEIGLAPCVISTSISSSPSSCPEKADGSIDLTVGGTGPFSYTWSSGASTEDIPAASAGTYYVTVTRDTSCGRIDSVVVSSTFASPTVSLPADTLLCNGESISLNAGSGYTNYTWSNSSTDSTTVATAPELVWINVLDSNFCSARDSMEIFAHPAIGTSLSFSSSGLTVTFSGSPGGASGYHWTFGDGDSSLVQNPVHSYSSPGVYPVCLTVMDSLGCSETLCDSVNLSITGQSTHPGDELKVKIGSGSGEISISLADNFSRESECWIYSMDGALIWHRSLMNSNAITLPLPGGMYIVKVKRGKEVRIQKALSF